VGGPEACGHFYAGAALNQIVQELGQQRSSYWFYLNYAAIAANFENYPLT
jgi:hypothetical protein